MYALIKRCLSDGKSPSWNDLWLLYDHIAAQPVRCLIVRAGFGPTDADEVANECYESLWENDCKRLRSFRGETEAELQRWLVRVAVNYAQNWIKRHWRASKRERYALAAIAKRSGVGPTEDQIRVLLDDLEAFLSHERADHLRHLAGLDANRTPGDEPGPSPKPLSKRTERQWKHDLEPEVEDFLGVTGSRKSKRNKRKRKKSQEP